MNGKRCVVFGATLAGLVGVITDGGREAQAQYGSSNGNYPNQPCPGCTAGCPDGTCNIVGRTIPPGYQAVWGTFALQVNKPMAGTPNPSPPPAWGSWPASLTSQFMTHYVTATNGGGPAFTGPNYGPQAVSFHVNSTTAGPGEHFSLVKVGPNNVYSMRTANGNVVTFVNGGGIGGQNDASAPIHTDAYTVGTDEKFIVAGLYQQSTGNWMNVTFKTLSGFYLTAVNGGGVGAPSSGSGNAILHTDVSPSGQVSIHDAAAVILAPQ